MYCTCVSGFAGLLYVNVAGIVRPFRQQQRCLFARGCRQTKSHRQCVIVLASPLRSQEATGRTIYCIRMRQLSHAGKVLKIRHGLRPMKTRSRQYCITDLISHETNMGMTLDTVEPTWGRRRTTWSRRYHRHNAEWSYVQYPGAEHGPWGADMAPTTDPI